MADYMKHFTGGGPITRKAGGTILAGQVCVFSTTADNTVVISDGTNMAFAGVAMRDATVGQNVAVDYSGEHDLLAAGAITRGATVAPAAAGAVAASATNVIGRATASIADATRGPVNTDL